MTGSVFPFWSAGEDLPTGPAVLSVPMIDSAASASPPFPEETSGRVAPGRLRPAVDEGGHQPFRRSHGGAEAVSKEFAARTKTGRVLVNEQGHSGRGPEDRTGHGRQRNQGHAAAERQRGGETKSSGGSTTPSAGGAMTKGAATFRFQRDVKTTKASPAGFPTKKATASSKYSRTGLAHVR